MRQHATIRDCMSYMGYLKLFVFAVGKSIPPVKTSVIFGRNWKVPYVFWFVGGTDPKMYVTTWQKKSYALHHPNVL